VENNGQKIVDSEINKRTTPGPSANLNSSKNTINGRSGSTIDTVNKTNML
jgi:hypothetical protein